MQDILDTHLMHFISNKIFFFSIVKPVLFSSFLLCWQFPAFRGASPTIGSYMLCVTCVHMHVCPHLYAQGKQNGDLQTAQ